MNDIKTLKQFGYRVNKLTQYHFQVKNLGFIFNIYPNRRTVYINGMTAGMKYRGTNDLIAILNLNGIQTVKHKRKHDLAGPKSRMFKTNSFCWLCNSRIETWDQASVDHVIPLSKGGSNRADNLRLTHRNCNTKKADQIVIGGSF